MAGQLLAESVASCSGIRIQGKGSVSLSLIRRTITLNFYSLKGLSSKEDIADHINQAFPYFKADSCTVKLDKMIFKTSRLPQKFSIPKSYKVQKGVIPIGCDEDRKIIQINTNNFVSLGLFCFSGSGKTTFLKNLINYSKDKKFFGFRTVIIDAKNDGDFDEFADHCQVIKTIEECLDCVLHKSL